MIQLFSNLTSGQAEICSLVLSSEGISHRIRRDPHGWAVWVDAQRYEDASRAIENYFRENRRERPYKKENAPRPDRGSFAAGLLAAGFLLAWHASFLVKGTLQPAIRNFGASAADIMNGEAYRAVTALMIHADAAHLAGNMLGIAVFGAAVTAEAGWGFGWLMILASGIAGNLLNALLYGSGHVSVGASTAVFGAIGIMAGCQIVRKYRSGGRRTAAWAPLAGGLALLGFIGSGENVDIMAHLLGFASGIFMGACCLLFLGRKPGRLVQALSFFFVLAAVFSAWAAGRA